MKDQDWVVLVLLAVLFTAFAVWFGRIVLATPGVLTLNAVWN